MPTLLEDATAALAVIDARLASLAAAGSPEPPDGAVPVEVDLTGRHDQLDSPDTLRAVERVARLGRKALVRVVTTESRNKLEDYGCSPSLRTAVVNPAWPVA